MFRLIIAAGMAMSLAARSRMAAELASKAILATTLPLMAALSGAAAATLPTSHFLTAAGPVTAVWANTGEDKVTRDELRTLTGHRPVLNRSWDGRSVRLFGAKNEVVAFNVVLEAGSNRAAKQVSVQFDRLTGPNGFSIRSLPAANQEGIFDWTQRDIELFYVKYLQIKGLSILSYDTYDEQHVPERFRRPQAVDGSYTGGWSQRPDRDKFYPDIAVPMETVPTFLIGAKTNQSVWADIYIPKDAPAGLFTGEVLVKTAGVVTYRIPVQLTVRDFTLPDLPSSKTMLYSGRDQVAARYTGVEYPNAGTVQDKLTSLVVDRQFLLAHRHKISMIDDNADTWGQDAPRPYWVDKLSGAFFTAQHGYRGPGEGVGNNVFSIGTYGGWRNHWQTTAADMQKHAALWEGWFAANSPNTDRFLYLIDESEDYAQTETWAGWVKGKIRTFATAGLPAAVESIPSLSISASWMAVGEKAKHEAAYAAAKAQGKSVYMYNGMRPASGSFATEDDGVALRELAWGQYKKRIDRWFVWEATYYNDYQSGRGHTNVFVNAQTFGGAPRFDANLGMTGWNYQNGDGVLFYPGIDKKFSKQSLGLQGPIASLRMKHWRRGIQDVDYLTMAAKIDPNAVAALVQKMVPKVLWENDVSDPADPSWVMAPISWSTNPDDWEAARLQLADIIEGG